ncbi:MAG: diacylglycerol kinase [Armatimonadetes bacterium]|nr:diacylglycerol kinase [Armatimonadota bacterium]
MKNRTLLESFNFAVAGIIYAFRTERNIRIHFYVAVAVLLMCLHFDLNKTDLMVVFMAMALVIVAEMFNTAIEAMVNLLTLSRHPLAKKAKDVSAGGVLLTAITALAVGYLVFYDSLRRFAERSILEKLKAMPVHVAIIVLVLVLIIVIMGKTLSKRGTPFKGGVLSGHTALAFAATTAIFWVTGNFLATSLAFGISGLVAHSRVEAGIHKWWEVLCGALCGVFASLILFKVLR